MIDAPQPPSASARLLRRLGAGLEAPARAAARLPRPAVWALLVALSTLFAAGLEQLRLPAALLLGPMIAAALLAASGATAGTGETPGARVRSEMKLPAPAFAFAQSAIGVMVGGGIPPSSFGEIAAQWPVFFAGIFTVIAAATGLGYLIARAGVLPGTTAVWGSSPGAASAMVMLAHAHGADMRLVAVMQYLRVGMVAAGASTVAALVGAEGGGHETIWFPAPDLSAWGGAAAVMAAGLIAARVTKLPAGDFLLPLLLALALRAGTGIAAAPPPWFMALAFGAAGWVIGLRFSRPILVHAMRALPRLALSVLALMGLCGLLALALSALTGADLLTAYLATSPGGADSVAIIAAHAPVDMPFVMAMQTARFCVVLAAGPTIARFVARAVEARAAA